MKEGVKRIVNGLSLVTATRARRTARKRRTQGRFHAGIAEEQRKIVRLLTTGSDDDGLSGPFDRSALPTGRPRVGRDDPREPPAAAGRTASEANANAEFLSAPPRSLRVVFSATSASARPAFRSSLRSLGISAPAARQGGTGAETVSTRARGCDVVQDTACFGRADEAVGVFLEQEPFLYEFFRRLSDGAYVALVALVSLLERLPRVSRG